MIEVPLHIPIVEAKEIEVPRETLQEMAIRIAGEYNISTTTLFNLVTQESNWDPEAIGDDGEAIGLVQIHYKLWGMTQEEAKNPATALKFASGKISEGNEHIFTSCSCIQSARLFGAKIPPRTNARDLKPNIPMYEIKKGDLLLFKYGTVFHVAVFQGFDANGFKIKEGNKEACKITSRTVDFNDRNLVGFWASQE